ncbi:MAG: DUF167 family protein [Alphaproteobacteria bacterium]
MSSALFKDCGDHFQFKVRLSPKASKNAVGSIFINENGEHILKASVTTVPEKGKANKALIALLSKEWGMPKSTFSIITGETQKNKILKIEKSALKTDIKHLIDCIEEGKS